MNGNANLNANNLTPQNVADWREKLGIADAPDLTNYAKKDASNLDSANITSWKSKLDIDDIQTQTNEIAQNITNIQNSVNNNANNITNLQNQVNVNSENISNNTNSISSLQTNLNNEVDALSQLIDANTDDISTNANNITNLQNNKVDKISGKGLSTNDFTNADKTKLDSLSNYDDTALKNRVSQNENDISSLQTNVNNNTTNITNLQSQVNSNTTNINQNSLKITNNTNSIETLATELLETNENVENNANNITQNTTNISSLQSGLSTTNTNVLNLTTRVGANENSIETLDGAIDGIKLKNTQQDGRLDAIELVDIPNLSSEVNTIKSNYITKNVNDLTNYTKTSDLAEVATTGDYNDLANRPTIPAGAVIYQQTGQNTNGAMSQKATTDALNTLTGVVVNKANADGTNITNVSIWQNALGIGNINNLADKTLMNIATEEFTITSNFHNAPDVVISYIRNSNGDFYREWSSGWKECGINRGIGSNSQSTIPYPFGITFNDAKSIKITKTNEWSNSAATWSAAYVDAYNITTRNFQTFESNASGARYYICGY